MEIVPVAEADGATASTPVVCMESGDVASAVALDRTYPTLLVLFVVLAICALVFLPFCELVQGVMTMPGTYAYVAPAMVGMVVLVLVPFLMGVGLGFFNTDYEFVGVENFGDILFPSAESDTNFYFTLGVTVLWTVSNVVLHVAIGLFLALLLVGQRVRLRGLFRVLLIVPWAVPNYITALVWKWMFTSQMGAINLMLEAVGIQPVSWFGPSFWTNFFAALATNTWLGFPFMMVVSMGALQSIPNELYEAAGMDGASRWQKFRFITLPLLKPALFPAIILGTIWTFNMFNIIYLVTRGRPDNKTNILITEAYRFFAELNQYGVAAAYCVLIFVILLLYTLVTNRVTRATQGAFE
ncbi:MAG: sugar ABC transporter permease [Deltaproteobacteria bacterium]|nr:sugar ABC transporter permease [Deltaproteobacteria bacterium]